MHNDGIPSAMLPRPKVTVRRFMIGILSQSRLNVSLWHESEVRHPVAHVGFSNRPFRVKRFSDYPPLQCRCRSRARASLRNRHQGPSIMGFEDEVEQSFGRPCRQCDGRSKRPNDLTSSIVPRGTSFHRWVELDFLPLHLILHSSQATATSLVHRNSVPPTHMRCMITANRRASATIAFFIPRCLAIFIAQALSQDHFAERTSMLWAAS